MLVNAAYVLSKTQRVQFAGFWPGGVAEGDLYAFTRSLAANTRTKRGKIAATVVPSGIACMLMRDLKENRATYMSMDDTALGGRILWQQAVVSAIAREMGNGDHLRNPRTHPERPCVIDGTDVRSMYEWMHRMSRDVNSGDSRELIMLHFAAYVHDVTRGMWRTLHQHNINEYKRRHGAK